MQYHALAKERIILCAAKVFSRPYHSAMSARCLVKSGHRYSITSLTRASNLPGTLRPNALAVLRLITN